MSTPEFRLRPWEHDGSPISPSHELDARIEGTKRRFEMKSHEGYVYFRFADEGKDSRVWSLLEPSPDEDIEEHFRREVKMNRVARFLVIERGFSTQNVSEQFQTELKMRFHSSNLHLFGPTTFAVSVDDEGNGFAQEWCGGEWFPFALRARSGSRGTRTPSIWSRSWNVAGLRRALAPFAGEFAFRPFSPDALSAHKLRFVRGSERELETLFRAACVVVTGRTTNMPRHIEVWKKHAQRDLRLSLSVCAETPISTARLSLDRSLLPQALLDLFLEHNFPIGGSWHRLNLGTQYDESNQPILSPFAHKARIDFAFNPQLRLQTDIPVEPSAHEQLEARLTLRDFLRDKWPRERIAALLG